MVWVFLVFPLSGDADAGGDCDACGDDDINPTKTKKYSSYWWNLKDLYYRIVRAPTHLFLGPMM